MIKITRVKGLWAALVVGIVSFAIPFVLTTGSASAASGFVWQSTNSIKDMSTGDIYTIASGKSARSDCDSARTTCVEMNYAHKGTLHCSISNIPSSSSDAPWPSGVNKIIQVDINNTNGPDTTAPAKLYVASGSSGNCNVRTTTITFGKDSGNQAQADYAYTSTSTIRNIHNGYTYTRSDATTYKKEMGKTVNCQDYIKLPSAGATSGVLHITTNIDASVCEYDNGRPNDEGIIGPKNITITKNPPDNIPGDPNSSDNATPDDCPIPTDTTMRWAVCSLVTLGQNAAEKMDGVIQNLLFTPTAQIFTPEMKQAWNTFRVVGVALILIAGLVMVISQSIGLELFDAYTVKKVLPRLLVAAIGIALSWPLLKIGVTFFNDLGVWAHDLIMAPFGNMAAHNVGSVYLATLLGAGAATYAGAIALGPVGIGSLLITIVVALLIGLLVLAVRQLVILVAILMAPLAIAAYILPGTQKLWEFWKNTLLTALMMFPIIMAFIAAGKALAYVAAATDSTEMHLLSVLVYFAPYFLLPFAFKLAGGLMSTIFSIANDKSRGVFDTQKKKRAEVKDDRKKRAASNSLWSPKYRRLNSMASWAAAPGSNTVYSAGKHGVPGFKRGSAKIAGQIEHAKVEQSGKLFEELNKMGFNDKGYRALSGIHDSLSTETKEKLAAANLLGKSPTSLAEIEKMGQILSSSDNDTERIGGTAINASRGRLATLFQDQEMDKADIGAAGIMGLAAHGFASSGDLSQAGNKLMGGTYNEKTGEFEGGHVAEAGYAQAVVSQAQLMGMRSRPDIKPGYGVLFDTKNGKFTDGMKERDLDVIQTMSSQDIAGAKGGAFEALAPAYREILQPSADAQQGAAYFNSLSEPEKTRLKQEQPEVYKKVARNAKAAQSTQAAKDQLLQWVGPYSSASMDVKNRAIAMIDDMSGPKETVVVTDRNGKPVKNADGTNQTTQRYRPGTIGAEYEQTLRTGMSPEQIEAMRRAGVNPDEAAGTVPGGGGDRGGH
jgi:hypothetical protein